VYQNYLKDRRLMRRPVADEGMRFTVSAGGGR
jgi:hypothetical protein